MVEYQNGVAMMGGGHPSETIQYLYDTENRWVGENVLNSSGYLEDEVRFA